MKRLIAVCLWVALCLLLGAVTISFWFTLPVAWMFQPMLFFTVLVVLFDIPERAILAAAICGFLLDSFSALPFGVFALSFFGAVVVVLFSQQTLLKGQAIHTVIIHTVVATAVYHLLFGIAVRLCELAGYMSAQALPTIAQSVSAFAVQALLHTVGMLLVYGSSMLFRKRFIQISAV